MQSVCAVFYVLVQHAVKNIHSPSSKLNMNRTSYITCLKHFSGECRNKNK